MRHKNQLNARRLTQQQVQYIIRTEGRLHKEFTASLEEKYASGFVKRDEVYELKGNRFLYVFDPKGWVLPGKGDIYPEEYFQRFVNWVKRVKTDNAAGRSSSVDHWHFYSQYKSGLVNHLDTLESELADKLGISRNLLDKSYASLDLISTACDKYGIDNAFENLYDNLVAYVGEVIRQRVNGVWAINRTHSGGEYPFVSIGFDSVQYMAINATWCALNGIDPIDFRKEAGNEIRQQASRANYARLTQKQ
ncbi:hypothetical protein [Hymenobacter sp. IS2118]|uniref:hypothetical protein n=1 Tax=Hymenobacter sp. IS2118 TaxID=1505605 RepID=UPI00126935CA|nr:hypothetical protein [Hymenobacter sp. IS2118]